MDMISFGIFENGKEYTIEGDFTEVTGA